MSDPEVLQEQREHLYDPHVAGINRLVDDIRDHGGRGWAPHVAPLHGGSNARLLWVLRDPGPKVVDPDRLQAGFLSVQNDDPTAQRLCELLNLARIDVQDTVPWNAYPWFINKAPTKPQVAAGLDPLIRLLGLLPRLEVVLLLGTHAKDSWALLTKERPDLAARYPLVLKTRHTGKQAFIGTPEQKQKWLREQEDVFREAAAWLSAHPPRSVAHGT